KTVKRTAPVARSKAATPKAVSSIVKGKKRKAGGGKSQGSSLHAQNISKQKKIGIAVSAPSLAKKRKAAASPKEEVTNVDHTQPKKKIRIQKRNSEPASFRLLTLGSSSDESDSNGSEVHIAEAIQDKTGENGSKEEGGSSEGPDDDRSAVSAVLDADNESSSQSGLASVKLDSQDESEEEDDGKKDEEDSSTGMNAATEASHPYMAAARASFSNHHSYGGMQAGVDREKVYSTFNASGDGCDDARTESSESDEDPF
ncbi:MAG: hypothetical protein SGILL_008485, partial [Bacillariaceae sp.]